jgi:hypothetical protein
MGTDINVLIGHELKMPLAVDLPRQIQSSFRSKNCFLGTNWDWKLVDNSDFRVLRSEDGPSVWLGKRAAFISTGIGWCQLAIDEDASTKFIAAMIEIARFFNSPKMAVLPDDLEPWCYTEEHVGSGLTFDEILAKYQGLQPPFASVVCHK